MATIHISQAEAASKFGELISRVRAGQEVRIDDDVTTIAVLRAPLGCEQPRLLSEIVAGFAMRGPGEPAGARISPPMLKPVFAATLLRG
jgi:antitoxin (DNA-binding transcriptional repressor) of toxin-antitoxin stability system